jgi:hypothetical protein
MGFSDLWVLFDAESAENKRKVNRHICCEELLPANPWLVIDLSNVAFSVCRLMGGNYQVFEKYCEAFWRAIYYSKFKLLIVKDGAHNGERGVIKLHRMLQRAKYLDPNREEDVIDTALFYESSEIRRRVMLEAMAELGPSLVVSEVAAMEEADDEIRKFSCGVKSDVLILSNDTSLILGQEDNKFIVSVSRLVLSPKTGHKHPMLYGPALKLGTLCTMWSKAVYTAHFDVGLRGNIIEDLKKPPRSSSSSGNVSPVNSESLMLVSCLLEGEYEEFDQNEIANGTAPFLNFLKNYCFPYSSALRSSSDRYDKKKLDFIVACTAIMLFARYQIREDGTPQFSNFEGFEDVLEESKKVAAAVLSQDPAGQTFFDLPRKNNGSFHNVCEKLLAMDVLGVMSVLRRRVSLITRNMSVTPGDMVPDPMKPRYLAQWGTWMSSEPTSADHSTDAVLHPFTSLMRQIVVARHCPELAIEPFGPSDATCVRFNEFLRLVVKKGSVSRRSTDSGVPGPAPSVWTSRLMFRAPEGVEAYTKIQVFDYVKNGDGSLPPQGLLCGSESFAGQNHGSSVPASPPHPPSHPHANGDAAVYTAYSAPKPVIHWEVLDAGQNCTEELFRHNFGEYALLLCRPETEWSTDESTALYNLSERAKVLSKIVSGELKVEVVVDPSVAVPVGPLRLAHPFVEVLLEVCPPLADVSKPIHKFWKKYMTPSFEDKDQCKCGSLGAAHIIFCFHQTYDKWAKQEGHSYSWSKASSDKVMNCLVDAVLLSPAIASFICANCDVTDGIEKNLKRVYPQILSKAPEKMRNITKQSFRWAEILHFFVKETLVTGRNVADSCSKDLFSWFDAMGIALIMQMGLKAEAYFPSHQCAALWSEDLAVLLGFKESELESAVSSLSEARVAVISQLSR